VDFMGNNYYHLQDTSLGGTKSIKDNYDKAIS